MKLIPNKVSVAAGRAILKGQKNSPKILFVTGVVGVIGTTVLASRATLRLEAVLEETHTDLELVRNIEHADYNENDRRKDTAKVYIQGVVKVTKLYGPALIVGVTSIACLTKSHRILSERNAALSAAYVALNEAFDEYRTRVVDEYGAEKDEEFRKGIREVEIIDPKTGKKTKEKVSTGLDGSPYARFFDKANSKRWQTTPEQNQFLIQCTQNYANDMLRARGHIFLNEVYDMLGMERSKEGAIVGWMWDGDGDRFVDFGVFQGNLWQAKAFVNGDDNCIRLDFNVDGPIYELI